jgi:hypothetical protein
MYGRNVLPDMIREMIRAVMGVLLIAVLDWIRRKMRIERNDGSVLRHVGIVISIGVSRVILRPPHGVRRRNRMQNPVFQDDVSDPERRKEMMASVAGRTGCGGRGRLGFCGRAAGCGCAVGNRKRRQLFAAQRARGTHGAK